MLLLAGCESLNPPKPEPVIEPEPVVEPEPVYIPEPAPEPEPVVEPPKPKPVPNKALLSAQEILQSMGLYTGQLDGLYGPKSRKALLDYQYWNGLPLSGKLDEATQQSLDQQ